MPSTNEHIVTARTVVEKATHHANQVKQFLLMKRTRFDEGLLRIERKNKERNKRLDQLLSSW